MAIKHMFANTSERYQQLVTDDVQKVREENAPGWNLIRRNLEKRKVGEKGLKIVYNNNTIGGSSTPTAQRPDWNEPVAGEDFAGYVYSTRYRMAYFFDHALIRDANNKVRSAPNILKQKMMEIMLAATKRLERATYLDGKGSLAYSTSTISALGSATMNCDTTPATTAGHTKGAMWLLKNNWYQAINETTGLPRGTFQVTAPGTTSCTVLVVDGTISSGDPIVEVNTYNGFIRGFAWLINKSNRVVQGVDTSLYPQLNSWGIDLAGAPVTFNVIEDMMTGLRIRNNEDRKDSKILFLPPGQGSILRKSGQNFRVYNDGENVVRGIAEDIDFGNNIKVVMPADLDEDRGYAVVLNEFGMIEEMELDDMTMDGQKMHQLLGVNNAGSETYQGGIGWDVNIYRNGNASSSSYFYRGSVTGVYGQAAIGY